MPERITINTIDDVLIVGDWMPAPRVIGAVILLHMMPETRSSWATVQVALAKKGLASLAIDLRGHGESVNTSDGDVMDYRAFEDVDHQTSMLDVSAAVDWVRKRGIEMSRIALGGASIGANLAISELTEEPLMAGAVVLSPGSNYHGTNALEDVPLLLPDQTLIIVASEDDVDSFADCKKIYAEAPVDSKTFVPYKTAGHGTNMLKSDPALADKMAEWFVEMISS